MSRVHVTGAPVAAFVVRHKTQLAPVVSRLRAAKLLRGATSVTPFRPGFYQTDAEEEADTVAVAEASVSAAVSRGSDPNVGCPIRRLRVRHICRVSALKGGDQEVREAIVSAGSPCYTWEALCLGEQCYAIHTFGHLSISLLSELLEHSVDEGGIVAVACVIPLLRIYSQACCAFEEKLPRPIAELLGVASRTNALKSEATVSLAGPATARKGGPQMYRFTFSELFAGIGMFRVGLERVGGRCIFAVECAPHARSVYCANHVTSDGKADADGGCALLEVDEHTAEEPSAHPPLVGDITTIPSAYFPHHDVLTGGFPCQSFAKAGSALGLQDEKGSLFFEVVRVIGAARPKGFLLENVENLLHVDAAPDGRDNGPQAQLNTILTALQNPRGSDGAGSSYIVVHRVVDGAHVTPQRRKRVYFFGVRADMPHATAEFVNASVDTAVRQLRSYLQDHPDAPRCVRDILETEENTSIATGKKSTPIDTLRLTPSQWKAVQQSESFRRSPAWRTADVNGLARTLMGSYRASYQLFSEFVPLHGHEPPFRFYSIRECARLQGIPESFSFDVCPRPALSHNDVNSAKRIPDGAMYRLIGNAVNPIVVEYLGRALVACLVE
ncbi:putative C 5 cytosine specific DNA methylase [Trypanosoma vivax]|nr:cytosine-specific DNA methylase [Trypanosoma vivax]KAH8605711.1 putative C 5 cytosine specific DNA methylase [Trypanosoma vivax]